jgi:hypothetical protein
VAGSGTGCNSSLQKTNALSATALSWRSRPPNAVNGARRSRRAGRALSERERALTERDNRLIFLKDDPSWASLRQAPRFHALPGRMKVDDRGPRLTPV